MNEKLNIEKVFQEEKITISEDNLYKYQIPDVDKDSITCTFVNSLINIIVKN